MYRSSSLTDVVVVAWPIAAITNSASNSINDVCGGVVISLKIRQGNVPSLELSRYDRWTGGTSLVEGIVDGSADRGHPKNQPLGILSPESMNRRKRR